MYRQNGYGNQYNGHQSHGRGFQGQSRGFDGGWNSRGNRNGSSEPDGGYPDRPRSFRNHDTNSSRGPASSYSRALPINYLDNDQLLRTVFIGRVPKEMADTQVQHILKFIPGFDLWMRVTKGSTSPCSFGFATFKTPESVLHALTALKSISSEALQAPDAVGLFNLVSISAHTKNWIAEIEAHNGPISLRPLAGKTNDQISKDLIDGIKSWLQSQSKRMETKGENGTSNNEEDDGLPKGPMAETSSWLGAKEVPEDASEEELLEFPEETRGMLMDEIKIFRRITNINLRQRRAKDEEEEKERQRVIALKSKATISDKVSRVTSTVPQQHSESDYSSGYSSDEGLSDDGVEERRVEAQEQRLESLFKERQRRWLNREKSRTSALEREKVREDNMDTTIEKARTQALVRYAEFKDGGEKESKSYEYYFQHSTWAKARMSFRAREVERDARDAELEAKELARQEEVGEKFLSSIQVPATTQSSSVAGGKIKLSLGGVKKAVPSTATSKNAIDVGFGEEEETKTSALSYVKEIVDIPSKGDALFEWPVKWQFLDEVSRIVAKRLRYAVFL